MNKQLVRPNNLLSQQQSDARGLGNVARSVQCVVEHNLSSGVRVRLPWSLASAQGRIRNELSQCRRCEFRYRCQVAIAPEIMAVMFEGSCYSTRPVTPR